MKKFFFFAMMAISSMSAEAQVNIQLHYDLGRNINSASEPNRPKLTSTVEMFKPDRLGSTYFFVDMDYYSDGIAGAYWEISREFTFAKPAESSTFAAHVEYDGGLTNNKYAERNSSYATSRFQQCFLLGPAWNWHNGDFSKTFSFQLMYKQYLKQKAQYNGAGDYKAIASFQATAVWSTTFAHGWCTFAGFADLWYGYTPRFDAAKGEQRKGLVFLTEPQFWLNIPATKGFSVGTEWEFSNDFVWVTTPEGKKTKTFMWNPTIAAKYVF